MADQIALETYMTRFLIKCSRNLVSFKIFTDSIARSATRRYLSYSEADFEVFRPAVAIRSTDGGEIWHGPLLHAKISPHRCNDKV